ncbi:autotransporter domain-containing protein [Bordetella petrii]|uniref:Autotransporter n=1 Tax=Bordetella petrii (strain ATCC BAA-461 / DSM 12804 / CCUG 43448 / CIP 107267 / Se-1111R) TaxID=340100 RepID=A9HWN6_BORPD|nr:autotransporter domain-containing protein [Bordetella petrii]CAP40521.1 autotransporter [Bordetella petrii]
MKRNVRNNRMQHTVLALALLAAFGHASDTMAINLTVETPYDLGDSNMSNSTITVNNGGILTGDGASVSGSAYDLILVNTGGQLALDNVELSNDLDSPSGSNGRTITASGNGATATLNNATISISAHSTNPGADYAHAFTAGAGATGGGNVTLNGGTVTASGSKRTVGIQANDGGSINATDVEIVTNNHFGHGVVAYRTPAAEELATEIDLDDVSITTHGENYSVGIQSANKGAHVTARNSQIVTDGVGSFGLESFNGAAIDYTGGSITTSGAGAAAVRVYGGELGAGTIHVDGTQILTTGDSAAGVVAADMVERTSGTAEIDNASIETRGAASSGLESSYGSTLNSTGSSVQTSGEGSHGAYAHDGGTIVLNGDSLSAGGNHAYGMYAKDPGSAIDATNVTVNTEGLYGFGARAENGGAITLKGGSISTDNATGQGTQDGDGSRAYALSADGANSSISAQDGVVISTKGQRAYGAYATNGGHIELGGGSVTTQGFMAYGLYASGNGSTVDANGVDITTSGGVGDGVWAYQGGTVNLNGGSVTVNGEPNANSPHETANGLVAVGGTGSAAAGTINASDLSIVTRGANSAGAKAGATVDTDNTYGVINLERSTITVQGQAAVAAEINYGSTLTATDSTLVSEQGDGIVLNDNASVSLASTRVEAAGASLVSNLNAAGQTQNITVGSGSNLTQNNGTLLQVNRGQEGMDGIVNLTLAAGSSSSGDVVDLDGLDQDSGLRDGGGKTNFTVAQGASWIGIVRGINDLAAEDGGEIINVGGEPIAGNVTGGQDSTIVFQNGADIGGGFSVESGSQASFNGNASIEGNVEATGSTVTFSGPATIGENASFASSSVAFGGPTQINKDLAGGSGSALAFSDAATISGNLSGNNASFAFSQRDDVASRISGNVGLDNNATLKGGSLAAPILIEGNVDVTGGATLGGNLTVNGSLNASGGTISPGNSVGTQTYASISNFGSAYVAEINAAGNSDLVIAQTGDVDLAGTTLAVRQENGNGGYLVNHDYTIVQTIDGEVIGQFADAGLDDSFANTLVSLDPVKYAAKDVKVSLSVDQAKVAGKRENLSSNQNHTLDGVISVAGRNSAADAALTSTDSQAALNQLSGEIHASTQSALLYSGNLVRQTLSDRLLANLGAGSAQGTYPLWAQVTGGEFSLDSDGNAAKARTTSGGLFLGGDAEVGKGWRIGAALGYTDSSTKVKDRASSKADVDSYTAALYGGKSWARSNGKVEFLAGAAYTHHSIDTRRNVNLGGNQTLKADYDAQSFQAFTELGYAFSVGPDSQIGPYLGVAWLNQHTDGFSESGGDAALRGDSRTDTTVTTTLGVRGKTSFELAGTQAYLNGGLGWRHANGDVDTRRTVAFITGAGSSFSVAGAPIAKDAAAVNLGLGVALGKRATMGVSYNGQFGDGQTDNNGSLYLNIGF